jgi:very-short-patch-repair endonuclease
MAHQSKTRHYEENINYGASPEIITKAKNLRKVMTDAEKLLWSALRDKQLEGFKFRRQHPIWIFIADFYCHQTKLVVELDGGIHQKSEVSEYDTNRTAEIEKFEIKVIRFKNEEVLQNLNKVLSRIKNECKSRSKTPSPALPLEGK